MCIYTVNSKIRAFTKFLALHVVALSMIQHAKPFVSCRTLPSTKRRQPEKGLASSCHDNHEVHHYLTINISLLCQLTTNHIPPLESVTLTYLGCELSVHYTCTCTYTCLLYTSPSPRGATLSRMPSSA